MRAELPGVLPVEQESASPSRFGRKHDEAVSAALKQISRMEAQGLSDMREALLHNVEEATRERTLEEKAGKVAAKTEKRLDLNKQKLDALDARLKDLGVDVETRESVPPESGERKMMVPDEELEEVEAVALPDADETDSGWPDEPPTTPMRTKEKTVAPTIESDLSVTDANAGDERLAARIAARESSAPDGRRKARTAAGFRAQAAARAASRTTPPVKVEEAPETPPWDPTNAEFNQLPEALRRRVEERTGESPEAYQQRVRAHEQVRGKALAELRWRALQEKAEAVRDPALDGISNNVPVEDFNLLPERLRRRYELKRGDSIKDLPALQAKHQEERYRALSELRAPKRQERAKAKPPRPSPKGDAAGVPPKVGSQDSRPSFEGEVMSERWTKESPANENRAVAELPPVTIETKGVEPVSEIVRKYFLYADTMPAVAGNREAELRDKNGKLKGHVQDYAETLGEMLGSNESRDRLNAVRDKIRTYFNDVMGRVPMSFGSYGKSDSWIYWDLAKQEFLNAHPDQSSQEYPLADPLAFETSPQSQRVIRDVVDRQIGWEAFSRAMNATALEEVVKSLQLQPESEQRVERIFKRGRENGRLASFELAALGRLIRRDKGVADMEFGIEPALAEAEAPVGVEIPPEEVVRGWRDKLKTLSGEKAADARKELEEKIRKAELLIDQHTAERETRRLDSRAWLIQAEMHTVQERWEDAMRAADAERERQIQWTKEREEKEAMRDHLAANAQGVIVDRRVQIALDKLEDEIVRDNAGIAAIEENVTILERKAAAIDDEREALDHEYVSVVERQDLIGLALAAIALKLEGLKDVPLDEKTAADKSGLTSDEAADVAAMHTAPPSKVGGYLRSSGHMGGKALKILGLGLTLIGTSLFVRPFNTLGAFLGQMYQATMNPEKYFKGLKEHFSKGVKEHGPIGGSLRGVKWMLVGDPKKAKKKESSAPAADHD